MIYIKEEIDGEVILAGEIADQQMLDDGYIQYTGVIPDIGEHQKYIMFADELTVNNMDVEYTSDVSLRIQNLLDNKAKELRYDNMMSARAVAGIPLTGSETAFETAIYNEAVKLAQWYLVCWGKASEIEDDVTNSVISRPTVQEVLDLMPAYV